MANTGRGARVGALVGTAVSVVCLGLAPPAGAVVSVASVTLTTSPPIARADLPEVLTASVTGSDGNPVADGTPVTFSVNGPKGGVIVDNIYVGIAGDATGDGYWLAGFDGQVHAYGTANSAYTGPPISQLQAPIAEIKATPSGNGFYLVSETGQVFARGDAMLHGDASSLDLANPITSISPTAGGYVLADDAGNVYPFGDATLQGQGGLGGLQVPPVSDIAETPDGGGYWLLTVDGHVWPFGDAAQLTSPTLPADTFATAM